MFDLLLIGISFALFFKLLISTVHDLFDIRYKILMIIEKKKELK